MDAPILTSDKAEEAYPAATYQNNQGMYLFGASPCYYSNQPPKWGITPLRMSRLWWLNHAHGPNPILPYGANFSKTTDTRIRVLVNNFLTEIQRFYDFVYRNVGHWNFMVLEYSSTFAESKKTGHAFK